MISKEPQVDLFWLSKEPSDSTEPQVDLIWLMKEPSDSYRATGGFVLALQGAKRFPQSHVRNCSGSPRSQVISTQPQVDLFWLFKEPRDFHTATGGFVLALQGAR